MRCPGQRVYFLYIYSKFFSQIDLLRVESHAGKTFRSVQLNPWDVFIAFQPQADARFLINGIAEGLLEVRKLNGDGINVACLARNFLLTRQGGYAAWLRRTLCTEYIFGLLICRLGNVAVLWILNRCFHRRDQLCCKAADLRIFPDRYGRIYFCFSDFIIRMQMIFYLFTDWKNTDEKSIVKDKEMVLKPENRNDKMQLSIKIL